jgi:ATP-dependent DNA helicase RecG
MQMGRGEELGSGVLNVSKYLPLYAKGAKPQFVEGNPFITVIPLRQVGSSM